MKNTFPAQQKWLFRLFFFLSLTTLMQLAAASPDRALNIEPADCREFINEAPPRVRCGFVSLPVDHGGLQQGHVTLPILIAASTRGMLSTSENAILIPGAGGPGAAMGFGYQFYPGEFLAPYQSLLQAGFDLVILDQRGAGFSSPKLSCVETLQAFKQLVVRQRTLDDEITRYQQATKECRKRLQSHHLSFFDTRQSARDFLTVMKSLPYRWWGTIATSYATTIAQAMMQIQPGSFNRVVLDSPVPLDFQKPYTLEAAYEALTKSVRLCQANNNCNAKYPDLANQFDTIIARARTKPYQLKIKIVNESSNNISPTLIIDDATLLSILTNAIYSQEGIAALPGTINQIYKHRTGTLRYYAEDYWYQSTDSNYADALNLTVHCKERQRLEEQYIKDNPRFLQSLSLESKKVLTSQQALCRTWAVTADNRLRLTKPVTAKTLVIAGSLDPVISNDDIKNTTDNFSNSTTQVISGGGHAVWFQSDCVQKLVVNFLIDAARSNDCNVQLPGFK